MKRIRRSPLMESARLNPLMQASEMAGIELTRFIDFIEYHNPDIALDYRHPDGCILLAQSAYPFSGSPRDDAAVECDRASIFEILKN